MEKNIKIFALVIFALLIFAPTAIQPVYAQNNEGLYIPKPETLPGPSVDIQKTGEDVGGKYGVETLLPTITKMLSGFAAITSFIFLVISGIRFMTAYGNTEAIASARKQAQWALIGLLLALFAFAIVSIITSITFEK